MLIIAIIIPMMIVFSSFITNVKADTYIDVENYGDNQWHWGVDVGDNIIFEIEFAISDPNTGDLIQQFKDIMILNITSIENISKIVDGFNLVFSQVNSTELYYNSSLDALEPIHSNSQMIAEFALNSSHPQEYFYMVEEIPIPILLPLNSSNNIEWANMTNILNDTMYSYMAEGNFSRFDTFGFNSSDDSFWFRNSTHGYYLNVSYYYNSNNIQNGTIKEAKGSILTPFGDSDKQLVLNFTVLRVFDYNITDEVVWGVDVGETFIYDFAEKRFDETHNETYDDPNNRFAGEIKIVVSKFNETTFWLGGNGFGDNNDTIPMVFQGVYADVYFWNFTENDFVLEMNNRLMGAANNFYPVIINEDPQFIIPISATQEDFEYMFNPNIIKTRGMPYDDMSIVWGSTIHFEMWNSTGHEMVEVNINSTNGIFMNYLMSNYWDFTYFELKNMTYIDWAVDIGDYFYFKEFSGYEDREVRITILGYGYYFDNLSYFFNEHLDVLLPAGQPELQFFSVVMGNVEHWDRDMERWVPEYDPVGYGGRTTGPPPPLKPRPIAAANKYWAIAPPMLSEGPPLLLPNGTTGYDTEFQNLFDLMGFMFDEIQYGIDWVHLRNTTVDTYMQYNFSATTGMTTLINGWTYRYDDYFGYFSWDFFSAYLETSVDLVPTLNTINLTSLFVSDISITAEIRVSAPGAEFIYALNAINPVFEPLPMGEDLVYLDLKITNHSLLIGNITLDITIPSYIDLSTEYLYFWVWNMGGTDHWNGAPRGFYDSVAYYGAYSLRFEIPMEGPLMVLLAISYGTEPPVYPPEDFILTSDAGNPDADGNFVLSWTDAAAESYSVYVSNTYITDASDLLIPLASNITGLTYTITDLPNGTYYFVVVAHNSAGNSLSNTLEVTVGTGEEIPGYNLLIVLLAFVSISAIIIKKRRKL